MEVKVHPGIPEFIGIFLAMEFTALNPSRAYAPDFFTTAYNVDSTDSVALWDGDSIIAATLALRYRVLNGGYWLCYFIVEQMSRRQGYGQVLIQAIKQMVPIIELECWSENTAAWKFYEAQGFSVLQRTASIVRLEWKD